MAVGCYIRSMAIDLWIPAAVEFDAAQASETVSRVTARIAEFGVENRKGNIIKASAIPASTAVQLSQYDHSSMGSFSAAQLPVGGGNILGGDRYMTFEGDINLGVAGGRELDSALRFNLERDILTQWSYGYHVDKATPKDPDKPYDGLILEKLTPLEASPVFEGANAASRTLGMDSARYREVAGIRDNERNPELDAAMDAAFANLLAIVTGQLRG